MPDVEPEAVTVDATSTTPAAPAAAPASDSAAPATDPPAGSEQQPDQDGTPPKPKGSEKTFTQDEMRRVLAKENARTQRRFEREVQLRVENEVLRRQLAERTSPGAAGPQGAEDADGEPRPENFKDWDSFNRAFVRWEIRQAQAERESAASQQATQEEQQRFAETVQERFGKGQEKYEDFEDVIGARGVFFSDHMLAAMMELDGVEPSDVAYNLALTPQETQRIAKLTPARQVLEIQKFASSLTKPPAPTRAPPPIAPGPAAGTSDDSLETAKNYKDWLQRRNRQLGRTA